MRVDRPTMLLANVVLPIPFRPIRATTSLRRTSMSTALNTCALPYPASSFSILRTGSAFMSRFFPEISALDVRIVANLGSGSGGDDLPAHQNRHAIGKREHRFDVVFHQQDRVLSLQLAQQFN